MGFEISSDVREQIKETSDFGRNTISFSSFIPLDPTVGRLCHAVVVHWCLAIIERQYLLTIDSSRDKSYI